MKEVRDPGGRVRSARDFMQLLAGLDSASVVVRQGQDDDRVHVYATPVGSADNGVGLTYSARRQSSHQKALARANAVLKDLKME